MSDTAFRAFLAASPAPAGQLSPPLLPDNGQTLMPPVSGTGVPDASLFSQKDDKKDDGTAAFKAFLMAPPANGGGSDGTPPPGAVAGPSVAADTGKSFLSGLGRGIPNAIDMAGAAVAKGADFLIDPFGNTATGKILNNNGIKTNVSLADYASGGGLNTVVDAAVGPRYQPQTTAGKYANAAGQGIAGSVIAPLEAATIPLAAAKTAAVGLGSGLGGQAGGDIGEAVGGDTGRIIGGVAGSLVGMNPNAAAETLGANAAVKGIGDSLIKTGNIAGNAASAAKTLTVGRTADDVIKDIIDRSGMTPDELLSHLQNGQITNLADVGGDSVQGLTRSVAKTTGGKDVVANELGQRAEGTSKRIAQDVNEGISQNGDYFGTLDDLAKKRSEQAGPLYDEAYKANKSVASSEVDKILATPAGRKALTDAVGIMQNDRSLVGLPDGELGEQARLAGVAAEGGVASGLNLRTLDYVKKALDDQINTLQRAGENSKAAPIIGLKKDLVSELDKADVTGKAGPNSLKPEGGAYARARAVASDTYRLGESQTAGLDFDKLQPQEISKQISGMSPAELDAYKIGVRQKLQQTVAQNSDNGSAARKVFGNDLIRDKVKAVFGDDSAGFDKFSNRMQEEIRANKTNQRVLGGSRTDFNIDADSDFGDFATQVMQNGLPRAAANTILTKATDFLSNRFKGISDANSQAIAKALVNREDGIAALERIYANQIKKTSPTAQAASQAITAIKKGGSTLTNPNAINNNVPQVGAIKRSARP